jgi:hypothetical protein
MNKPMKRKPGRPSLGKRRSLTFRIRDNVNDLLVAAAESSAVSVSEEIERRVEESFSKAGVVAEMFGGVENAQLLFMFAVAIQEAERGTGKSWWQDVSTSEAVQAAIDSILVAHRARLPDSRKRIEYPPLAELGRRYGPFIDHFQIGNDAAALAMAKAKEELAVRNAPVKASELPQSSTRKATGK